MSGRKNDSPSSARTVGQGVQVGLGMVVGGRDVSVAVDVAADVAVRGKVGNGVGGVVTAEVVNGIKVAVANKNGVAVGRKREVDVGSGTVGRCWQQYSSWW